MGLEQEAGHTRQLLSRPQGQRSLQDSRRAVAAVVAVVVGGGGGAVVDVGVCVRCGMPKGDTECMLASADSIV